MSATGAHGTAAPAPRPSYTPPRVALIGTGGYGRVYLDLLLGLHARAEIELTAATVINAAEEAPAIAQLVALGCEIFPDAPAMFAAHTGRLALCCIPTGIPSHAPLTIAALQAGANVLVEKPLAGSAADARAIQAAERASGRFVAVGFQDIWSPETLWLKHQILAGRIGPLRTIRFIGQWPRPASYYTRNGWAGALTRDGRAVFDSPLNNAFAHFAHLALFLAGPAPTAAAAPERIAAELWRAHGIESCDTAFVRAHLAGGAVLFCGATHASRKARDPEIFLEGPGGRIHWHYERAITVESVGTAPEVRPLPTAMEARGSMFAGVLQRLHDPAALICDTASAAQHVALVAGMHAAAPITDVPAENVTWITPPGESARLPCIHDIERTLGQAWTHLALPRELARPLVV